VSAFSWPKYPETDHEFDELMQAIDEYLTGQGLQPFQRPLMVGRLFWEAFKWGGQMIPPKALADCPGFSGDVLMAKANRWYEQTYADKLKMDQAYGHVPVKIGNAIWRVRFGLTYGQVELFLDRHLENRGAATGSRGASASYNVLCAVEELPQGMADKLSEPMLDEYFNFYVSTFQSLQWREALPRTDLLQSGRADFDQSTADVMAHRYSQARWAAQQAVEKTLKGLLSIGGTEFPRGGANGHNLTHLGELLKAEHGIFVSTAVLDLASCSPRARYGEEPSTEAQALLANHAVLAVLEQLRSSSKITSLLALAEERFE